MASSYIPTSDIIPRTNFGNSISGYIYASNTRSNFWYTPYTFVIGESYSFGYNFIGILSTVESLDPLDVTFKIQILDLKKRAQCRAAFIRRGLTSRGTHRKFLDRRKKNPAVPELLVVQKWVADRFNLSVNEMWGANQSVRVAWPRMVAMFLCRELCTASSIDVGNCFGGRNHATVLHACKVVRSRCEVYPDARAEVAALRASVAAALARRGKREGGAA